MGKSFKFRKLVPGYKFVNEARANKVMVKKYADLYSKKNHLYEHFKTQFAPGHFYSPYPSLDDIDSRADEIFDRRKQKIDGIDIHEANQLRLLKDLSAFYKSMPYLKGKSSKYRYYLGGHAYSHTDATILYCMLHNFKPRRIIEIGSGYSSALMLDFKQYNNNNLSLTFIDPYPELLQSLAHKDDDFKLIDKPLHGVDKSIFYELEPNDILFIDSTHVAKPGSDVNQIYFQILPLIKKGVIIHIHDIFYPFEYPIEWIKETRAWNEDYVVRAYLYNNNAYQILLFNHFLNLHHNAELKKLMPTAAKGVGGSLWLKKVA